MNILITGSSGLIGSALARALTREDHRVIPLDLRAEPGCGRGDVRSAADVAAALRGCDGVVHLAAVSRVIDAERDPELCWDTNVEGTRTVLTAAADLPQPPWVLYASSREVYGQPEQMPVTEDAPLRPVNIYGRSKVEAEHLVSAIRPNLRTAIVRFSNVYGATSDHADRVVPAFARQAAFGLPLRVDGSNHIFDFTHLDDSVRGIIAIIKQLQAERSDLPPVHFVTGVPTTLGELAALAVELATSDSPIREAPPRNFDVARFLGDPGRAETLLGWRPRVALRDGLARLIAAFRAECPAEGVVQ